ncbi:MAG: LemA family protein [Patescibacteria group bacterium]
MNALYIVLGIIGLIILWVIIAYNSLIRLRFRVKEAWSDIDVQLKRRYDLIPNVVETVKGYASHEKQAFENVTEARAKALGAEAKGNPKEMAQAENALSGTLKTLFAIAENYPDLKANVNFLDLQRELSDTENKIQASRRFYNSNVMEFNTRIHLFPTSIIAGAFKFEKTDFFELQDGKEKEPIPVKF